MAVRIVDPDAAYRVSFFEAWNAFDAVDGDGKGWVGAFVHERAEIEDPDGFDAYLAHLRRERVVASTGWVTATMLWAVEDGRWLGRVSVRHELNEYLATQGGHIGYAVIPSQRRRGIATQLLIAGLDVLGRRGLDRALVTCDDSNAGSIRVIEACGGVLENIREGTRCYWIAL